MTPFISEIRDETFHFYAERAVHWPRTQVLLVSDLHLGKAETFQQNGLWLPQQAQRDDLARLSNLVQRLKPLRLLILGDLIHTKKGVTDEVEELFAKWLHAHDVRVQVLIGNHDRQLAKAWPKAWSQTEVMEVIDLEGFHFRHEPGCIGTSSPISALNGRIFRPDLEFKIGTLREPVNRKRSMNVLGRGGLG